MILYVGLSIAVIIPSIVLYAIRAMDLYKTGNYRYVILSFGAGILAYALAAIINPFPINQGWIERIAMVRYVAPIVEEILKAVILFFLVRRHDFTYFVDGAIYGFGAGVGFAIAENFEYILLNPDAALSTAASRVISTNLMHASATAILGIVLAIARFKRFSGQAFFTGIGFVLAIAVHMGFNNLVTRVESGWVLLYAVLVGGGAVGFIALAIRRGLQDEREWIEQKLGSSDRVERQEITAVQKLSKLDKDLAPLVEIFGAKKASQIEQLLLLQARLGILKMTAEKLSEEKMRRGVESQIQDTRIQMENARQDIGMYTMAFLRKTYLEPSSSIYRDMQQKIQQRMQSQVGSGFNTFEALKKKITDNKDQ